MRVVCVTHPFYMSHPCVCEGICSPACYRSLGTLVLEASTCMHGQSLACQRMTALLYCCTTQKLCIRVCTDHKTPWYMSLSPDFSVLSLD